MIRFDIDKPCTMINQILMTSLKHLTNYILIYRRTFLDFPSLETLTDKYLKPEDKKGPKTLEGKIQKGHKIDKSSSLAGVQTFMKRQSKKVCYKSCQCQIS